MKVPVLTALVVIALVATALGGTATVPNTDLSLYREEVITNEQIPGGITGRTVTKTWIKGVKLRTDADEGNDVTIIRPDLELVYTINMARRVYTEAPLAVYRRAARLSLAMLGADPAYQWTNREKKIGDWQCREVVLADETNAEGDRMKTVWWVSQDVPIDQRSFRQIMQITMGDEMDEIVARFFKKLTDIPGYPVVTETSYTRGQATMKTSQALRVIKPMEIDDAKFDLPEGLTKVIIPLPEGMK